MQWTVLRMANFVEIMMLNALVQVRRPVQKFKVSKLNVPALILVLVNGQTVSEIRVRVTPSNNGIFDIQVKTGNNTEIASNDVIDDCRHIATVTQLKSQLQSVHRCVRYRLCLISSQVITDRYFTTFISQCLPDVCLRARSLTVACQICPYFFHSAFLLWRFILGYRRGFDKEIYSIWDFELGSYKTY